MGKSEEDRVLLIDPAYDVMESDSAYDDMFSKEDWNRITNEPLTPGF